jgi:ribose transport system ATP-binding protein
MSSPEPKSILDPALALEAKNIVKHFGGIEALKGIDLSIYQSEICALVGENGAGKSTFVKILTGATLPDQGDIYVNGRRVEIDDPITAKSLGIVAIYQEVSLIEHLSVAKNIFLGHEEARGVLGWNDERKLIQHAKEYLDQFGVSVDPRKKVKELGLGEKRIIEILKALSANARILLLDEPTTGMSWAEIESLFKMIADLKKKNVTMIYISHNLEEIFRICDRVAVLRDGRNAGIFEVKKIDTPTLVQAMIGKSIGERRRKKIIAPEAKTLLELKEYQAEGMKTPISLKLRQGEILGITGIVGAGKSELGFALFGVSKSLSGALILGQQQRHIQSPLEARRNGIAFIPEDRKSQGIFLTQSVETNLTLVKLEQLVNRKLFIPALKRRSLALEIAQKVRLIPLKLNIKVSTLSGGNQQKVVIGKWLLCEPNLIIMDEPTRGVDVGAKEEIYKLVHDLADQGAGVIILSSEFEEICRECDRVLVLRAGKVVHDALAAETSGQSLLAMALGG